MSKYIKILVMREFNRIDHLPPEQFDDEYAVFVGILRRLYPNG